MFTVIAAATHVFQPIHPMTIAQIIAAKKAAATKATPAPQAEPELDAAIARIDPPSVGKRRAAALVLSASTPPWQDNRLEVPQELIQPADDVPMCLWLDRGTVWLCMPCADKSMPPIKVLRLPWTLWPVPATEPLPDNEPF